VSCNPLFAGGHIPTTFVRRAEPQELHNALDKNKGGIYFVQNCFPAPQRGEILRQIREALAAKVFRGQLVVGKI